MAYVYVREDELRAFCCAVFEKYGFSAEESAGITDVLIVNNVSAANTNYHISNIEGLLTQKFSGSIAYPEG